MKQEALEAGIAAVSSKASYTTAGAMGLASWLTSDIVFGVIGVVIGVATMAINRHYKRKADARKAEYERRADDRAEREMQARMRHKFGTGWDEL